MVGIHKVSIKPELESLVINYSHSGLLCHCKHTELFGDSGTLCCDCLGGWGGWGGWGGVGGVHTAQQQTHYSQLCLP